MTRAITNEKLWNNLKDSGIAEAVKKDADLALFLRGRYITVYYKTLQILKMNSVSAVINEKYLGKKTEGKKAKYESIIIPGKYGKSWSEYFKYAKEKMDDYQKKSKQSKSEKEYQQELIRKNQFPKSEYQIIDVEYAQNSIIPNGKNKRFDAVAIHHTEIDKWGLAFIELKVGNSAVYGDKSGVSDHLRSAGEFYADLINKGKENNLYADFDAVITQLHELGLLPIEEKISRTIKPQMIFAMVDFKIDKHKQGLDGVIEGFLKSEDKGHKEARKHYEVLFSDLSAENLMTAKNMKLRAEDLKTPEEVVKQIKNERGKK